MNSISKIVKKLRESRILNERADYSSYSREELISLAQSGDQLAFETLVNSHDGFLRMMSSKYIMDNNDPEDVKQLATIAFWDAIASYNPKKNGDFEAYAGMIIKRKLTNELRKDSADMRKLNHEAGSLDEPIPGDSEGGSTVGDTVSTNFSAEEEALGNEGARALMKFMETNLSDTERDVIKMYIEGYKVSEIAEETGMKYKSVENAVKRVKDKLAEYMRSDEYNESKKIEESDEIIFSDKEKQILKSMLAHIDEKKSIPASLSMKLKESYENYTEEQIDQRLWDIDAELDDYEPELPGIPYDTEERYTIEDRLEELTKELWTIEDYATDDQYKLCKKLLNRIGSMELTPYDEYHNAPEPDPYDDEYDF